MNPCCDYAHYYLGCDFRFTWHDGDWVEGKIELLSSNGFMCGKIFKSNTMWIDNWYDIDNFREFGEFQLILRHQCDMTYKQKKKYKSLCYEVIDARNNPTVLLRIVDTPESLKFLFDNGIDAFDLIESGHAIDIKPEIKKPNVPQENGTKRQITHSK